MKKLILYVFCVKLLVSSVITSPAAMKQYRTDYMYNRKTDAFYKLHIETKRHWQIDDLCRMESASVLAPVSDEDIAQVHMMFKKYPNIGPYVWATNDGLPHESAEEQPIIDLSESNSVEDVSECDVVTRDGDVKTVHCVQDLPFVCKVDAKDAPYDERCKVYGRNYEYNSAVGSCYKIPRMPFTWNEAYAECAAEGAHLVIVNSETERGVIKDMTNSAEEVRGSSAAWFFLAGFRAEKTTGDTPRVFKTIFNQTLEQAGFAQWSDHEPNNAGGDEYCGSVFKNDGKLNDVDCMLTFPFICEKEL